MTGREKQAIRFTIIPTIEIIDEEVDDIRITIIYLINCL
jgi:hypothetical protein